MATASSKTTSVPSQRQPQFAHLETRFVELMTELFQLDEAEALDFGLYRIIRREHLHDAVSLSVKARRLYLLTHFGILL